MRILRVGTGIFRVGMNSTGIGMGALRVEMVNNSISLSSFALCEMSFRMFAACQTSLENSAPSFVVFLFFFFLVALFLIEVDVKHIQRI